MILTILVFTSSAFAAKRNITGLSTTADQYVSGPVSGTWGPNQIYHVVGDIIVEPGDLLTILEGVTVIFEANQYLSFTIAGTLKVLGTKGKPVLFTANTTWEGFRFANGSQTEVNHSTIEKVARLGYNQPFIYIGPNAVAMFNECLFRNFEHGLYDTANFVVEGSLLILNSTVKQMAGQHTLFTANTGTLFLDKVLMTELSGVNHAFFPYTSLMKGYGIELINCTISNVGNANPAFNFNSLFPDPVSIRNSIIYLNHPYLVGEPPFAYGASVNYSDIETQGVNYPCIQNGTGNIEQDPLFVDPANGNYQLKAGSPCIDAGDPDPIYNDPDGTRNDLGAFYRDRRIKDREEERPLLGVR